MTSALSITRSVGAPRAAFVDFPLGHTTGKKNEPEMQKRLIKSALAAFHELREPGGIKILDERWSDDATWRKDPMRGGASSADAPEGDFRTPRLDTPQYQLPSDQIEAEAQHRQGGCGSCVGAE
ncbi:MAG: hypothetical protein OSB70_00335 [Myxococcota bacterium]|jgi:hypothetical protein|nr:hypothetical protein [Myxococcota bacterium]